MKSGKSDGRAGKQSGDFCPRCGLVKERKKNIGSLTGYLFQDTRCRCAVDEDFKQESMSQKFWKLKASGELVASRENLEDGKARTRVNLVPGAIIAGVYEIKSLIGRGGMGEVYLAKHATLGKRCALKVIPPEQVTEVGWQRFQTEARLFSRLDHANLVRVTDLGIHDGCLPFYAMDYIEGHTLSDLIAEHGRLKLSEVLEIFIQVCDGVDFAHRHGIIHRDLKPANIIISVDRSGKVLVKILDFGLAKLTQHDRGKQSLTAVGEVFGSPFYMSPEQCEGEKLDNRSDIYSIGCTMYECLCERPPFTGHLAQAIMAAHRLGDAPTLAAAVGAGIYPDSMEVVLAKLLRKNPAERYQTMAELKGDLEKISRGEEVAPFYVSRSRSAPVAAQENSESEVFSAEKNAPGAKKSFSPLIAVVLVAAIVTGGAAYLAIQTIIKHGSSVSARQSRIDVGPGVVGQVLSTSMPEASAFKWDGKPYYQGISVQNGSKVKVWKFPANLDDCPATISAFMPDRRPISTAAQGTVSFPAQAAICLYPQPAMVKLPHYTDGLTDGNIDQLKFTDISSKEFLALVPKLKKLKSVTEIVMAEVSHEAGLPEQVVEFVNNFPQLTTLSTDAIVDGRLYQKIKRIKNLRVLEVTGVDNHVDELYQSLGGSTALRRAKFTELPVSARHLHQLGSCPNLETLIFRWVIVKDKTRAEDLRALCPLKHLRELAVSTIDYSEELVNVLSQLKSLNYFFFNYSGNWKEEHMMKVRRAIPYARILALVVSEPPAEHKYPPLLMRGDHSP